MSNKTGWEELDVPTLRYGVFAAEGYSPDPIAIFHNEDEAAAWLKWQEQRGDDGHTGCDYTICAIDGLTGLVWNSHEPVPSGCATEQPREIIALRAKCELQERQLEVLGERITTQALERGHLSRLMKELVVLRSIVDGQMGITEIVDRAKAKSKKVLLADSTVQRCPQRSPGGATDTGMLPRAGAQCGLPAGHDGDHSVLVPTGSPWAQSAAVEVSK